MAALSGLTGFSLEVDSEQEFDAVWAALRLVFPVFDAGYESTYQENQVLGKGYIKWCPNECKLWSSRTKLWHEFMLEFTDYKGLQAHLLDRKIYIPDLDKSPATDELDLDFEVVTFEEATTADAREFVKLLDQSNSLSGQILELQGQAQEKLEQLDSINQRKERLRKLLNIGEGE